MKVGAEERTDGDGGGGGVRPLITNSKKEWNQFEITESNKRKTAYKRKKTNDSRQKTT